MTNLKKALYFTILVESDGSDKTVVVDMSADPVAYSLGSSGGLLLGVFNTLPADVPTDSLSCSLGINTASYSSVTHQLTVTFNNTGTDDTLYALSGIALY